MSHHARIEEVYDDPSDDDISTVLPASEEPISFATSRTVIPTAKPPSTARPPSTSTPSSSSQQRIPIPPVPQPSVGPDFPQATFLPASQANTFKAYQCVYPVYFDARRSRAEGRKVSKKVAVENPLAREIVEACNLMGLRTVFEPGKTHPKDWANPGRIRVELKKDGVAVNPRIKNKFELYERIGEYLKQNPTTPMTPLKLRIPNVPYDGKPVEPPVVPRGWKLGTVLPLHSPALSGGGVSDDIFKDMMAGMGMGDVAGPSGAGGEKKDKKEKKKKR